ncbi:hypothetical protein COR50_15550 [Chitinophaga caeni]|uniref:TIGR00374 family protein n=1 Tax=Chitinophaga caeni TaxID=2029983 RepID=A0A291QX73_9BACT|nr:lysylphosphatidylglycerol synthase transmembrane domain-containing protein [Chitinophaga caeni]ATL48463.1 hypothetical protein COR50_15550 [Chitinophaga caeni]
MQSTSNLPSGKAPISGILKNLAKFALFLGLGVLLIWLALKDISEENRHLVIDSFKAANYWLVIPAFIIGFFSHFVRATRWKLIMHSLGYNPSTWNTFFAVMIGYLTNLAVPRLGEVARCGVLARYEKLPADKLVGTMIAERAVDLLCLGLLFVITILSQLGLVSDFLQDEILGPLKDKVMAMSALKLSLVFIGLLIFILIILFLLRKFSHSKTAIKLKELIRGVWDGILSITTMERKGMFVFQSLLIWFLYFAMMYVGFYTMGETSHLGVKAAMSLLAFGSIGMIVTPGGIGAYPLLIEKTLSIYKVAQVPAFAFGWIIWGAQTILILILGLLSFALLPIYNRKRVNSNSL